MVNVKRQPPVSTATLPRLMDEMASDRSSAASVADVVAADPGLTAKVMALANSAQFGMSREVDRLAMAIQLIGDTTLQTLAIANAACMFDVDQGLPGARDHSFRVGCAARLLAPWSGCGAAEAFAAGLLHDLGELLLWQASSAEYGAIYGSWPNHDQQVLAEIDLYGVDHATVAAEHLATWNVPSMLVEAVRDHAGAPSVGSLGGIVAAAEALIDGADAETVGAEIAAPAEILERIVDDLDDEVAATAPLLLAG